MLATEPSLPTKPNRRMTRLLISEKEAQLNHGPSNQAAASSQLLKVHLPRATFALISKPLPGAHPGKKCAKELGIRGPTMRRDSTNHWAM